MNTKKQERIYKQYDKENDLLFPVHDGKEQDVIRDNFMNQLVKSPDFVAMVNANYKLMAEPVKDTIKNFNIVNYILIGLAGLTFGGITTEMAAQDEQGKIEIKNISIKELGGIILLFLLGIVFGTGTIISFKQINQESAIDSVYYRASVRLFKELKKYYPELSEDVLKSCNPEMARVIKTLLITNMSIEDVFKIRSIAFRTLGVDNKTKYNSIDTLEKQDKDIKEAIEIIERNLLFNDVLKNEILHVYRGNVPATFILQKEQQKIK